MPATTINITAVEESTARALRLIAEQQDALHSIDRIVNNMEDAWTSDAQKSFTESFRASRAQIERFTESVNESVKTMRSFVTDCINVDELTARELRGVNW